MHIHEGAIAYGCALLDVIDGIEPATEMSIFFCVGCKNSMVALTFTVNTLMQMSRFHSASHLCGGLLPGRQCRLPHHTGHSCRRASSAARSMAKRKEDESERLHIGLKAI